MSEEDWYIDVGSNPNFEQGEILLNCPVIIPPKNLQSKMQVKIKEYNVIILSQTCDILNDKIDAILVCPIYFLEDLSKGFKFLKNDVGREVLRRGNVVGLHLLNKSSYFSDFLVVDFRKVYSIHKNVIKTIIRSVKIRQCLISPYKEHLSQAFARFFMRVGLPNDIEPFCKEIYQIS